MCQAVSQPTPNKERALLTCPQHVGRKRYSRDTALTQTGTTLQEASCLAECERLQHWQEDHVVDLVKDVRCCNLIDDIILLGLRGDQDGYR